ncbi:hypothetical protein EPO34_00430 [Patescibacteria group bacterium]|nr:MAG: hypothetical protein EPO34_00430 [Patescibacteria group bacterium]
MVAEGEKREKGRKGMRCDKLGERSNMRHWRAHINLPFWRAVAGMVGGTVGVGVFGLPFAFSQSGFAIGLTTLAVVAAAVLVLNLMYGDLVLQTAGRHRFGGYVREHLGDGWGHLASMTMAFGVIGAMLAFMVVGGRFLEELLMPLVALPEEACAFALAATVAAASYRGTRLAARVEGVVVGALLFLFAFLTLAVLPEGHVSNLAGANLAKAFVPYGVVLFALAGGGVIPDMRDVLGARRERELPHAIGLGLLLIVALYAAFSAAVLAATGSATTPAALTGLIALLGPSFGLVVSLLGSLVVASIFLTHAVILQNQLHVDHGVKRTHAWLAASLAAPALYLLGLRDFIAIIGFVGSVFGGVSGLLIIASYEAMRTSRWCREHVCLDVPFAVSALVAVSFIIGILAELHSL